MRQSLSSRAILFLLTSAQLVVPGAASWADAKLEVRGRVAPVHIESHSTSACARVHRPDCGLCQFLASPLTVQSPRQTRFAFVFLRVSGPLQRLAPVGHRRRAQPQPRAPPSLS